MCFYNLSELNKKVIFCLLFVSSEQSIKIKNKTKTNCTTYFSITKYFLNLKLKPLGLLKWGVSFFSVCLSFFVSLLLSVFSHSSNISPSLFCFSLSLLSLSFFSCVSSFFSSPCSILSVLLFLLLPHFLSLLSPSLLFLFYLPWFSWILFIGFCKILHFSPSFSEGSLNSLSYQS